MRKQLLIPFFIAFFAFAGIARAQVLINEVCSATEPNFFDENGDAEDWFELYNNSGSLVNMQGYTISKTENAKTTVWTFPNFIIQPFERKVVFCSEKDRKSWFDHWEIPVYPALTWRYIVPTTEPPAAWRTPGYNDSGWLTGPGGIGYGDGDDATVIIPNPDSSSVYMRYQFTIADTSIIAVGAMLMDVDDAFVAYLNDVEIARVNIGTPGDNPAFNDLAIQNIEAVSPPLPAPTDWNYFQFVDESVMDSAIIQGNNVLCIQTHNHIAGLDDLSSTPLLLMGVKNTSVTYPPFPAVVHLHTNFDLNSTGQTLILKNPSGGVDDEQIIGAMQMSDSRGRSPDGSNNWCLFDGTTPDSTNNFTPCFNGYSAKPIFSLPAGFYTGTQTVSISATPTPAPGTIHYTIDGSEPTGFSPFYSTPLTIDSTQVVRARLIEPVSNLLPVESATNTYFINDTITLPVVSISTDPYNMFDYNNGIYVLGPNADTTLSPCPCDPLQSQCQFPYLCANFWQGWETRAHTEYFDKQKNQCFELDNGLKIHGNYSKGFPQKGLRILANDDYGTPWINYKLFPEKNIIKFKSFNLRNAGIDWNTAHMRDGLMQRAVRKANIDIMDHESCVVFVNGQYFGVYELRERQDKYYIQQNHGVDADKIDLLRFYGDIQAGSNEAFVAMATFIATNNMALATNYDSVKKMIDISNFCSYFATEVYYDNPDWLGNNIKFWRVNDPPGKWRYVLWDTDGGLGLFSGWATGNLLPYVTNSDTVSMYYGNPHSFMIEGLLANTEFKQYFINRYADMMNTFLHPINLSKLTYKIRDNMQPEMARHFVKWGVPVSFIGLPIASTEPEWQTNVNDMLTYINNRPDSARYHVRQEFSLIKNVDVTLDVVPAGAGKIQISTIIPDSLPWTGVYFNGNPVTMTAIANPGYKFKYWKSDIMMPGENQAPSFTLDIDTNDVFRAYFVETENNFSVYPNPFSNNLTISYQLKDEAQPSLKIYSVTGQLVAEILTSEKFQQTGTYTIEINPDRYSLRSGIYFIEFKTSDFYKMEKIVRARE